MLLSVICLLVLMVGRAQGYDGAFEQRKIAAAEFAVEELRKTSDSGVYDSIKLMEVISAVEEEGIYHHNMIMELKLGSPHFLNHAPFGYYNTVVMRHKETGGRSLAIDEFPLMDEDAVEKYWIAKVERKRAEREEAFRRMELESLLMEEDGGAVEGEVDATSEQRAAQEALRDASIDELFEVLETAVPAHSSRRAAASTALLGRLQGYREQEGRVDSAEEAAILRQFSAMEDEEALLRAFSPRELFSLSKGSQDGLISDYLVYRSRQILDAMLSKHVH